MSKLLKDLWSFVMMGLMIAGIAGLAFNMFRDDGWMSKVVGVVWDAEVRSPLIVTPVIVFSAWIGWLALTGRLATGKGNPFADLMVIALAISGAYFLGAWYWD